jgi:hypothetical protein
MSYVDLSKAPKSRENFGPPAETKEAAASFLLCGCVSEYRQKKKKKKKKKKKYLKNWF